MLTNDTALILIDVQKGFDDPVWGPRNNPGAEANIARLLALWRASGRPIFHVRHDSVEPDSPLRPGQRGNEPKEEARPAGGEATLTKHVNSAFIGTDLERRLRERRIRTVVLVGLTTDHCVSTTARMAGNLGFDTYVVADATAAFARRGPDGRVFDPQLVHDVALASLHGEFATVVTTRELERLLG